MKILSDDNQARRQRAYTAAALGLLGERRDPPWNVRIGFGLNYRAAVETLTGWPAGILDLL